MTNLTRYKQKIFANNSNQVGVFGTGVDKETSKNVETLQSAEYEGGWSEAIITNKNYPIWQEMDGVQYGFSYQLAYILQKGLPDWLATETYYTNDFCKVGNTIYYSLSDDNINHNPTLDEGYWAPLITSSRSVGEIVPAILPLNEAGLHLLDGALIEGTGIYTAFVTYIANMTSTAPNCFTTEALWQQSVTDYGACGKFVYDNVNNTVRLPKITGLVEGTIDANALGDLVEAGLPNIKTTAPVNTGSTNQVENKQGGCIKATQSVISTGGGTGGDNQIHIEFDASQSSSIYKDNFEKVQPQTIKGYLYMVIATSTKTDIEVDIDEIATDLNGKADVDLSNMSASQSAKDTIMGWLMLDYSNIITIASSAASYTAPSNGLISFNLDLGTGNCTINGNTVNISGNDDNNEGPVQLPLSYGDVITFPTSNTTRCFIPCKGVS